MKRQYMNERKKDRQKDRNEKNGCKHACQSNVNIKPRQ